MPVLLNKPRVKSDFRLHAVHKTLHMVFVELVIYNAVNYYKNYHQVHLALNSTVTQNKKPDLL